MESNIDKIIKLLDCIIDICENHLPKYSSYIDETIDLFNIKSYDQILEKYFPKELKGYKNKEQMIHSFEQFKNDNLFYDCLLDDFKLYMHNILFITKKVLLANNSNNESLLDSNISFIYYYNFVYFLKYITSEFPEIIKEEIYKIDLIFITGIFSPDYKITFENGILDKYGTTYESYTILMIELINLIKEKKYIGYKHIAEIENYEYIYPQNWNNLMINIEGDILRFLFFYFDITYYDIDKERKFPKIKKKLPDIQKIYDKFEHNPDLNIKNILFIIDVIIKKLLESKYIDEKSKIVKEILNNIEINENYKLLNEYDILLNLCILSDFYSLNKNDYILQKIKFIDLIDSFRNEEFDKKFQFSSSLNFIKNRPKIIDEAKNAKNYAEDFQHILSNYGFRNKIKKILKSDIIIDYYKNPKYYYSNDIMQDKLIGKNNFIDIYMNFLEKFIDNNKIYEIIIYKRMPSRVKGAIIPYLSFIIDPFGMDMNNNIANKDEYIEAYLIILFIQETNHFSKRSFNLNLPLSSSKTPKNAEGGESIIRDIFGKAKIYIIDKNFCDMVNNVESWEVKTNEEIIKFKEKLGNYVRENNIEDLEELVKIKEKKSCLISFFNYRSSKKNTILYSRSNGGLFCF